jgi:hypothetical protein
MKLAPRHLVFPLQWQIGAPQRSTASRKRDARRAAIKQRHSIPKLARGTAVTPKVYGIAAGLVAWFVLSAWMLFDHNGYVALPLAMVSVLLLIAVLLPWLLSRVWKKYHARDQENPERPTPRDWGSGDFSVWGARLHGSHATIDMLLPLAAVAFGLTAIGIVFVVVAASQ